MSCLALVTLVSEVEYFHLQPLRDEQLRLFVCLLPHDNLLHHSQVVKDVLVLM